MKRNIDVATASSLRPRARGPVRTPRASPAPVHRAAGLDSCVAAMPYLVIGAVRIDARSEISQHICAVGGGACAVARTSRRLQCPGEVYTSSGFAFTARLHVARGPWTEGAGTSTACSRRASPYPCACRASCRLRACCAATGPCSPACAFVACLRVKAAVCERYMKFA